MQVVGTKQSHIRYGFGTKNHKLHNNYYLLYINYYLKYMSMQETDRTDIQSYIVLPRLCRRPHVNSTRIKFCFLLCLWFRMVTLFLFNGKYLLLYCCTLIINSNNNNHQWYWYNNPSNLDFQYKNCIIITSSLFLYLWKCCMYNAKFFYGYIHLILFSSYERKHMPSSHLWFWNI